MEPNVFWRTKDWKEQWEVADIQGLLAQAQAAQCAERDKFAFHDVPSRAFCDEDTIAIGPAGMRCDEATAELLHDHSALPIPGTDVELGLEVHWDGRQFWLRPSNLAECRASLEADQVRGLEQLLAVQDRLWFDEQAYNRLLEQLSSEE